MATARAATLRDFLIRGLLIGLLAGVATFGVAYALGEPSVNAAIALEEQHAHAHGDAQEPEVVPRSLQSTLGLATATVALGVTLGGLAGVLSALALGRFGGLGARASTLLVAGAGFTSVYLMPFVAYPANPPAVGQPDTIGIRSGLYFTMLAISVIAAVVALLVGRRLAARWGGWYAALAAIGGYLVVCVLAIALLPTYNEVPADFPAVVLYQFRAASLVSQLTLWGVIGLGLAEAVHRLTKRSGIAASRPLADVPA